MSYSNNAFGQKSLEALLPLLSFDSKRGLRSLHLKHCKMAAKVTKMAASAAAPPAAGASTTTVAPAAAAGAPAAATPPPCWQSVFIH